MGRQHHRLNGCEFEQTRTEEPGAVQSIGLQRAGCDLATEQHCIYTFYDNSIGKESACNARDPGLIPGLGRSPGEGNSYTLQYSGLENSMEIGVWQATVTKSWTQLSDFHFL